MESCHQRIEMITFIFKDCLVICLKNNFDGINHEKKEIQILEVEYSKAHPIFL